MLLNIKKVAFPREHGSWGFLIEPLLLSLLVAYTYNGLLLTLCTFVIFLAHQPARILLGKKDSKKLKSSALLFFILYSIIAILLLVVILSGTNIELLTPFLISIVLMFGFLVLEYNNFGRNLLVEFIAPVAITFVALNIVLFDGWTLEKIIAFGFVLLSRAIPTLLYVNTKVKIIKGQSTNSLLLRISEVLFLSLIIFLAVKNSVPYLSIFAILLLIVRSIIGLLPKNKNEKVRTMGMKEFGFGILFVIINAIGYLFDL
ncbi:MAG: YwiC-like family protein [Melioribacteraceae bacterium]